MIEDCRDLSMGCTVQQVCQCTVQVQYSTVAEAACGGGGYLWLVIVTNMPKNPWALGILPASKHSRVYLELQGKANKLGIQLRLLPPQART